MADIFISYARIERDEAEALKTRLEALGLSVFLDVEGLDGGDVFSAVLDREVKTSGVVLGLWSPAALSRPWVQIECDIGKRRGVLIPVAIKPFQDLDVPAQFWNMQYIDLSKATNSPDDRNWLKLVQSLARSLKRPELLARESRSVSHDAATRDALAAEVAALRAEMTAIRGAVPEATAIPQPQTAPTPQPRPLPERARRSWPMTLAIGLAAALLLGGGGAWWLMQSQAPQQTPPQVAEVRPPTPVLVPSISPQPAAPATVTPDAAPPVQKPAPQLLKLVLEHTVKSDNGPVWHVAFSPDGTQAATGTYSSATIWDVASGKSVRVLTGAAEKFSYSPDGKRLAGGGNSGEMTAWDTTTGAVISKLTGHTRLLEDALYFFPDSKRVLSISDDFSAGIWDSTTGQRLFTLKAEAVEHASGIRAAVSPDGRKVFTTFNRPLNQIWDAATGQPLNVLKGGDGRMQHAVFSPDSTMLAGASYYEAELWDVASGKALVTFTKAAKASFGGLAFSPDGRWLALAVDLDVQIWNVATRKLERTLDRSQSRYGFGDLLFSPDGTRLLGAAFQGAQGDAWALWDVDSGAAVGKGKWHTDQVQTIAISPDGKRIMSGSHDKTAKIWRIEPQ